MAFTSKKDLKVDVVEIVNNIIAEAISHGASDIHIEPSENGFVVRFRVDGVMRVISEGDLHLRDYVIARIKVMADVDTTGVPRPQEGNIKFSYDNKSKNS